MAVVDERDELPRQVREALDTLERKTGGLPSPLVDDIRRLYREREAIKAQQFNAQKEADLLSKLDAQWAESLNAHIETARQRAAAERDAAIREATEAERAASAPPTRKLGETNDEFLARGFASLHAQQQHHDQIRRASLDVDFVRDESDPSVLASVFDGAMQSGHVDRISVTGRVIERKLRTLAEHEARTDAPNRPASAALARVTKQIADWRTATEGGTPAARRASAQARFDHAMQAEAQRVGFVKDLVGLGPKRAGM